MFLSHVLFSSAYHVTHATQSLLFCVRFPIPWAASESLTKDAMRGCCSGSQTFWPPKRRADLRNLRREQAQLFRELLDGTDGRRERGFALLCMQKTADIGGEVLRYCRARPVDLHCDFRHASRCPGSTRWWPVAGRADARPLRLACQSLPGCVRTCGVWYALLRYPGALQIAVRETQPNCLPGLRTPPACFPRDAIQLSEQGIRRLCKQRIHQRGALNSECGPACVNADGQPPAHAVRSAGAARATHHRVHYLV